MRPAMEITLALALGALAIGCTAASDGEDGAGTEGATGTSCVGTACGDSGSTQAAMDDGDGSTADEDSGGAAQTGSTAGPADGTAATEDGDGSGDTSGAPASDATDWILANFADVPVITGDFSERMLVETPALVMDATNTNAKYAFTPRDQEAPTDKRSAFVDVTIVDLVSPDGFGGAIGTSNDDPDHVLYLSDVYVEPNWPEWVGYDTTNYDGIVLDGSAEFYAEDLTIVNWNADSAIDIKSQVAQFVRLQTEGDGNRTLRFWQSGPHHLVESSLENQAGTILWFSDCASVTLYVYESTFNGAPTVPADKIDCDDGDAPNIVYLDTDPRTTGEMHPMFSPL